MSLLDVAPTILDFAGIDAPTDLRGISLRTYVEGTREPPFERPILGDMPRAPVTPHLRSLIKGNLKLIHVASANRYLLFDLARDPGERHPRADPELSRRLIRELGVHFSFRLRVLPPQPAAWKSIP